MSVLGEADGMKESDTFHFLLSWPAARGGPSFLAVGLSLLLLGSCQTPPSNEGAARPVTRVRSAEKFAAQTVRYVIRSEQSDVRFLVYRAGALARLGHSHVVQAGTIKGEIHLAPDIRQSSFSLVLPIADFKVDAAESRAEEGEEFSVLPDDEAIAGTTKNMLGEKVLDAVSFPQIEIGSLALSGPAWGPDITVRIKLHGVEREITVPTAIDNSGEQLVATAFFSVNQSDFGITPLSVLGGAIQVANTVRVRMRLVAKRA